MRSEPRTVGTMGGNRREDGAVMIAVVFMLLPVVLVTGAYLLTMNSRTSRLASEIADEHAFQAAEAGVDACLFEARMGVLTSGVSVVQALPGGSSFVANPTHLGSDGLDNDGDLSVDEADEDIFQVVSTGTHYGERRRVAAYLGRTSFWPPVSASITSHNPGMAINLNGSSLIDGTDTNINGTAGDPTEDRTGISIANPGTQADLLSQLTISEQSRVDGQGGTPSLGTTASVDLTTLVEIARNAATFVLTNSTYSSFTFGDASLGTAYITFRDGDVAFAGNVRGSGLLVVTGDLKITGNFRFDGLIIVLGNLDNAAGTAEICGGVMMGPSSSKLELVGTSDIHYSQEALDLAARLAGTYVSFNGWQELSRN